MRCAAVLAAALTTSISVIPSMLMAQAAQPTGDVRPIPISTASRTTGMLRIDGRLDESDWAQAAPTDSFTQIDPDEGKPATQPTEVRVLYNGEFLYVGARLRDSGAMRARLIFLPHIFLPTSRRFHNFSVHHFSVSRHPPLFFFSSL